MIDKSKKVHFVSIDTFYDVKNLCYDIKIYFDEDYEKCKVFGKEKTLNLYYYKIVKNMCLYLQDI